MRKFSITFFIVTAMVTSCFGQDKKFTMDDFNVIVKFCGDKSLPLFSESKTFSSALTFRAKLDSIANRKLKIENLKLTPAEAQIVLYILRDEISAAAGLLLLQQKLAFIVNTDSTRKK